MLLNIRILVRKCYLNTCACTAQRHHRHSASCPCVAHLKQNVSIAIRTHLSTTDWVQFMTGDTFTSWNKLEQLLLDLADQFIPMKKCNRKGVNTPVWMTQMTLMYVRKKHRVFMKYENKDHPAAKAVNAKVDKQIRRAKLKFEHKLAFNIKQDRELFFASARSKSSCKKQAGSLMNDNSTLVNTNIDIASCFNQ